MGRHVDKQTDRHLQATDRMYGNMDFDILLSQIIIIVWVSTLSDEFQRASLKLVLTLTLVLYTMTPCYLPL